VLLGAGVLSACAPPPASDGDFTSADPGAKLYAIVRAGEACDRSAIPHLIEQLGSDDQAVRMYAIGALRRITGRDFDYVYYADPVVRERSIVRWVEAYESGELNQAADAAAVKQ
jgi:hypothetical protein